MTTMVTELYSALRDAGASEEKATRAAEAVAGYDNRFSRLEADMLVLKWMVGAILTGVVIIIPLLVKILAHVAT